MKVYIASSVSNRKSVIWWTQLLRAEGHLVFSFVEHGPDTVNDGLDFPDLNFLNAVAFLEHPRVREAFYKDKSGIDWSDAVLLLLPAGRSAHLEAGYAVGQGKQLYVFQSDWPAGHFDVMYGFAQGLYDRPDDVIEALRAAEVYCGHFATQSVRSL